MQQVTLPPMDGGINEQLDPSRIGDNQMVKCLNFEYDRGGTALSVRNGIVPYTVPVPFGSGSRFTSLFGGYRKSTNTLDDSQTIATVGQKIFGEDATVKGLYITISTGLTLPNDALWQWSVMNDLVVGVNGAASGSNPVSWDGINGHTAQQLAGSPPKGKYIAHWNGRLFILKGNKLYYCKLGDCQDWTAIGVSGAGFIEIGYDDGELGSAIWAHKEKFFIAKKSLLYQIVTANPNTDTSGWRLELYTKQGGCPYAGSVQPFGDNLIFMGGYGLSVLSPEVRWTDFLQTIVSRDLRLDFNKNVDSLSLVSVVRPDREQYMLFLPDKNGVDNKTCLVMDRGPSGNWRFVKWQFVIGKNYADTEGVPLPISAACVSYYSGVPTLILGAGMLSQGSPGNDGLWSFRLTTDNEGRFDDQSANVKPYKFEKELKTKKYTFGNGFIKKLFNHFGARFGIAPQTSIADIVVDYSLEDKTINPKTPGSYPFLFDSTKNDQPTIWRRFSDPVQGRQGNSLQLTVRTAKSQPNVGFYVKELAVENEDGVRYRSQTA